MDITTKEEIDKTFTELLNLVNPLDYFSKFVAPELEGCDDVKKAILLMLASDDKTEKPLARKRIHIGLIGEPGTGKTVIMKALERDFSNVKYLTQDTSRASLKGDARNKKDMGIQIFKQYHGGIICIDEVELMNPKDRDNLRDVMENGWVQIDKGGFEEKYPARVRIILGSNTFENLSKAMIDRLDFIFNFKIPSVEESKRIAKKVVEIYSGKIYSDELMILKNYICWIKDFSPEILEEDKSKIEELFDNYFELTGVGRSGRWISKVMRIAFAHAKLNKRDVKVEDVKVALSLINNNEKGKEGKE